MKIPRKSKSMSLAAQAFELGIAAPQVVAHRVARMMAGSGRPLSARDRAEFHLMGAEKVAAAHEAWAAMATQALQENQKLALSLMQSMWFPWMRPFPTAKSLSRRLNRAAMGTLGKGLAPVRRRAVANAKRLGRGA